MGMLFETFASRVFASATAGGGASFLAPHYPFAVWVFALNH